ncbi:bystin-like protein [Cryptosporidium canis]|uniref:Bystin-like protein n=1 Tax=Cryptosporidium canis TaxID=195482 RepID=A0A9D5HW69_9CRYT|nr:bystin-like protein [Cryptosporidium canis]
MPKFRIKSNPLKNRNPLHIDIESASCPYLKPRSHGSGDSIRNVISAEFQDECKAPELPRNLGKKILVEANKQLLHDLYGFENSELADNTENKEAENYFDLPVDNTGLVYVDEDELGVTADMGLDDSYWSGLLKNFGEGNSTQVLRNHSNIVNTVVHQLREKNLLTDKLNNDLSNPNSSIPEKLIQVYTSIGEWLSKYKSGKLPKAFTIIPKLENWEEILHLTDPYNWSPNAMNEAVRIFSSNLSPKDSQRFYSQILYPAIRTNISQNYGKLNYHYYQALKTAMFKPAAWFKGILLPLAEDETCTVKEAIIIGSILSKVSIPVLHTAAAIIKLSQIKTWNTCQTHFIMILLCKKYSMPKKVIDELVENFTKFDHENSLQQNDSPLFSHNNINLNSNNIQTNSVLPVTWHKTLLVFVQRYKYEFSPIQIKRIHNLVKNQYHYLISPEIIRELSHSLIKVQS